MITIDDGLNKTIIQIQGQVNFFLFIKWYEKKSIISIYKKNYK